MNIVKATRDFERWLARQTHVVRPDILLKHRHMREAPFSFFRATFYRWMQAWLELCPDLAKAPRVLAVGDLHVENFGTWRDVEGRLIWGVNDFDEVAELPYTNDLVRLAASVVLAIEEGHLTLSAKDACESIIDGYSKCLAAGGRPFVLAEKHIWLRDVATSTAHDPVRFWAKMDALPTLRTRVPPNARRAIHRLLPQRSIKYRLARRTAGMGSLGHIRLVAIADFGGGRIAREVKALVPSAVNWATNKKSHADIEYEKILATAVRARDPFVDLKRGWIGRRLAPYCSRIELELLPNTRDEQQLLFAMGWETANIHLGSRKSIPAVRKHLRSSKRTWLAGAAKDMAKAVVHDWRVWISEDK